MLLYLMEHEASPEETFVLACSSLSVSAIDLNPHPLEKIGAPIFLPNMLALFENQIDHLVSVFCSETEGSVWFLGEELSNTCPLFFPDLNRSQ